MQLTLAFVMDPMERVAPTTDTSFALMLEAARRGHRILHVHPAGVGLEGDQAWLDGTEIEVQDQPGDHFRVRQARRLAATACDALFIRTDPPFDQDYLTTTWLLSFAERAGVRCINSPRGLRAANEKLYALELPDLCPRSIVTSSAAVARAFMEAAGGEAIAKPLHGHGGLGVLRLRAGDSNVDSILGLLTGEGVRPILVQEFLGARCDKRLFLLDGELRATLGRMPTEHDHRANVHVGGRVQGCEPNAADRAIAAALRERLRADGIFFAGVDVIDGKLIEVNVTSPTLVRELLRLGGPDLAAEIFDAVEGGAGRAAAT